MSNTISFSHECLQSFRQTYGMKRRSPINSQTLTTPIKYHLRRCIWKTLTYTQQIITSQCFRKLAGVSGPRNLCHQTVFIRNNSRSTRVVSMSSIFVLQSRFVKTDRKIEVIRRRLCRKCHCLLTTIDQELFSYFLRFFVIHDRKVRVRINFYDNHVTNDLKYFDVR